MVDTFDRQTRRYASEVREDLKNEELRLLYRSGRTSFKFSQAEGLQYTGTDANNIIDRYRRGK